MAGTNGFSFGPLSMIQCGWNWAPVELTDASKPWLQRLPGLMWLTFHSSVPRRSGEGDVSLWHRPGFGRWISQQCFGILTVPNFIRVFLSTFCSFVGSAHIVLKKQLYLDIFSQKYGNRKVIERNVLDIFLSQSSYNKTKVECLFTHVAFNSAHQWDSTITT